MTGEEQVSRLDRVQAAHPCWMIRRDVGPEWSCWIAQRVRVVMAPSLTELDGKLNAADGPALQDPRVAAARALLAEKHQPLSMTPGDVRALLARYRKHAAELLDVLEGSTS